MGTAVKSQYIGGKMIISEEYKRLMYYDELPERFRAGDFGLLEDSNQWQRGV
jgi:hypothetical protein